MLLIYPWALGWSSFPDLSLVWWDTVSIHTCWLLLSDISGSSFGFSSPVNEKRLQCTAPLEWSKGLQAVDLWTNLLLWITSAISKPPVHQCFFLPVIGKWLETLVCLLLLWPLKPGHPCYGTVGRRFEAASSLLNVLRVAGRSVPCLFWQGPMLVGLSNGTSMSREK